ncbi:serine/threonine protein kinase [Tolypothrix sp. NIES-4075]|uniref:serine/threonine protein kinase n=1 Tax=Tolypothrix sp. NIES-4075 TaxID=2005459 RepID=UPI000B72535A|nr:serine/threonine-protein kinase [Tolypothrix sp. NIES-4075]GAX45044.1 serine/threonine protein kinase [Tolypothrix sp. NIES-4075]
MVANKINIMVKPKKELDAYIGKFLNNRYLIRDLIGKGGMGRVYLAEDAAKGGMAVAVKILSLSLVNQQMSQRFVREIFIGAQLGRKSKHIVRVLSYGITEEKIPFCVMEYLPGKNLKNILKNQVLTLPQFLDFCHQICLGLECAHQGITLKGEVYPVVHRDIKPENIFIIEDVKVGTIVKILDFGIAKFLTERAGMTLTDSFIGSLPYCSPEHIEGRKLLDMRSDIYSLGVLMFEMLTGKHPFYTTSQSFGTWYQAHRFQIPPTFEEVNPQVKIPQKLEQLVISCLAKDASDRPQNINEILTTLEKVKTQLNDKTFFFSNLENSSTVQLIPFTSVSEKECLHQIWPKNKPIAPIGFPHLLHTHNGTIPTFWAMLPKKEINKFIDKTNSTDFISKMNIYPMILWTTILHNPDLPLTRWLSYFLDMKDSRGQKIVQILAETGYYHLLFFAFEEPTHCAHVKTLTLTASQRQQLADWLELSQNSPEVINSNQAKVILKAEYEKIKPEILRKLALNKTNSKVNVKILLFKIFYNIVNFFLRPQNLA